MKYRKFILNKCLILAGAFLISGVLLGQSDYDCLLKAKALLAEGKNNEAIGILSTILETNREAAASTDANIGAGDSNGIDSTSRPYRFIVFAI